MRGDWKFNRYRQKIVIINNQNWILIAKLLVTKKNFGKFSVSSTHGDQKFDC